MTEIWARPVCQKWKTASKLSVLIAGVVINGDRAVGLGEVCAGLERGVDRVAFMHAKAYEQFLNEIGLMEIDRVIHGLNLESHIPICRFLLAFEALEDAGDE